MKTKNYNKFSLTLIMMMIFATVLFYACEKEEPPAPSGNTGSTSNNSSNNNNPSDNNNTDDDNNDDPTTNNDDDDDDDDSGYGELMVWTAADLNCGYINVYIDGGYSGQVTSYYYSGTPDCGASGCVTKTVAEGQHTVYAECESYTWPSNTYNIASDQCHRVKLNTSKSGKPVITITTENGSGVDTVYTIEPMARSKAFD